MEGLNFKEHDNAQHKRASVLLIASVVKSLPEKKQTLYHSHIYPDMNSSGRFGIIS